MKNDKQRLHDFWNEASCGEKLYLSGLTQKDYEEQARVRYELEPYIAEFADFETAKESLNKFSRTPVNMR